MLKENDFIEFGKEIDLSKDEMRLNLSNNKNIYYIEDGEVDIFVKEKKNNVFIKKNFLVNLKKESLFFGFENIRDDILVYAVATNDAKIYEISYENLLKNFENDKLLDSFFKKLEHWVLSVFENIIVIYKEDIEVFLPFEKEIKSFSADKKEAMIDFSSRDKSQICWAFIKKGEVNFLGEEKISLKEGQIFPMSYKSWFSFKGDLELCTKDTISITKEKKLEEIITFFQNIILNYLVLERKKNLAIEKSRFFEKKDLEKKLINKTLVSFFNIFEKKPIEASLETKNILFNVLKVVGKISSIQFNFPKKIHEREINNIIFEIAENSLLRYRKVSLKNNWYEKESSNFLGFLKEDNKPVAIVRVNNYYEIIDPDTKNRYKITEKNVIDLEEGAYEFYDTFGIDEIDNKKILKFCFKNQNRSIYKFILFSFLSVFLAFYIPFANSVIFNRIIPYFEKDLLYQISFGLFIAAFSSGMFSFISSFITLRLQSKLRVRFQIGLFDRFIRLPISFFRKYTTGDLQRRLFEMFDIQRILSSGFLSSLFMGLFSFLYLIQMFFYSWSLTLITISFVSIFSLLFILILRVKIKIDGDVLNEESKLNGFILQILSGIEKIRLSSSEKILFSKWGDKFSKIRSKTLSSNYLASLLSSLNGILLTFGTFFIFGFSIYLLKIEKFNLGNFIAFNAAYGAFIVAINSFFVTLINYIGLIIPRWKRSKVILNEKPESTKDMINPGVLRGNIDIEKVSFRYDENSPLILQNISIKANPGELIALVGPTNCGKSTLIRLLLNNYQPNSGSIYFDGKNLSSLDTSKVRKQIGVVLQDGETFSGTIEENLLSTKLISIQEMENAMKITRFDETLKFFPMGLHTYLTDNGKNLSGGQKQQLLLTRALIGRPKVLILDEATAFLDNHLQKEISDNIEKLRITRIVIAHRLDTIKNADRIYLMKDGRIMDSGNFEALYAKNEYFKNLVDIQAL